MVIQSLLALALWAQPSLAKYDEIRDTDGQVRPQYEPLKRYLETAKERDHRAFLKRSLEAFEGDNPLSPVPRMIDAKEFEFISQAVNQRARALLAFLKDHYGAKTYRTVNLVPQAVVERALMRSGETGYQGQIQPEHIAFLYGPDIVRAEHEGKLGWYILEDNTGYVGGFGDLVLAHELIQDLHPNLSQQMRLNNPLNFYQSFARSMRQRALEKGGVAVLFRSAGASDNEGERVEQIFGSLGITVVSPESGRNLKVENGTVYVYEKGDVNSKRKVGYIFLEDELAWVDHSTPSAHAKYIHDLALLFLDPGVADKKVQQEVRNHLAKMVSGSEEEHLKEIRKILVASEYIRANDRSFVPGLVDAVMSGSVGISNSPGTDFVNDKEIYIYVERMIRYYLRETPLMHSLPSRKFANDDGTLNQKMFDYIFQNLDQIVIKRFDGRGGSSVWIGRKMKPNDIKLVKGLIQAEPTAYKAQALVEISEMNGNIGDIRPIAHVDSKRILIADVPWGRGAPAKGSGKVNIAAKGHEVAVIVGERCEDRLR